MIVLEYNAYNVFHTKQMLQYTLYTKYFKNKFNKKAALTVLLQSKSLVPLRHINEILVIKFFLNVKIKHDFSQ